MTRDTLQSIVALDRSTEDAILEIIRDVLPMSENGRAILRMSAKDQIVWAYMCLHPETVPA